MPAVDRPSPLAVGGAPVAGRGEPGLRLWYKRSVLLKLKLSLLSAGLLVACASAPDQPGTAPVAAPAAAAKPRLAPGSPAARRAAQTDLKRAIRAARAGDMATTAEACEAAITHDPQLEHAYLLLGSSYALRGQADKEAEVYRRGLKALPRSSAILREQGLLYMRAGLYPEAVGAYEQARELAQEPDPTLDADLAYAYLFVKRVDEARALAIKAYTDTPSCFACAMSYGQVCLSTKDYPHAVEAYARARALQPKDVDARRSHAKALFLAGQAAPALAIYRSLVVADPADARLKVQASQVAMAAGEPAEAAAYLQPLVADNPGSAPLLERLLAAQRAAKDAAGAATTAQQLNALNGSKK